MTWDGIGIVAMRRLLAAGAVALVVLAGCTDDARARKVAIKPPPDTVASIQLQHAEPAPLERRKIPARKPEVAAKEQPEQPAPDAQAELEADPKQLIGLDTSATTALLGKPAAQEEKPPARVWTYNGKDCVLNIFFYADINTRQFHALTYEIKNDDQSDTGKRHCMGELMRHNET